MIHGPSTTAHGNRSPAKQIAARRVLYWGACAIVVAYGGLLRLDAFVGKYGTLDHPAWARVLTHDVASVASTLKPSTIVWTREQRPYVGGDPIGYLAFAREMRSFYQPHVREPVFLATTKAGLWMLAGQDAGISLASAAGSTLTILGLYLLGSVLASRPVGLLAAFLGAIEIEAVGWAPDGWRDDTFTATVLFAAWSLLRLRQRPDFRNALLAGLCCGLACLTRITAVSFVLPALLWIVNDGDRVERRRRLQQAATALLMASLVVAPYLISCAIATGDPLIAINYHTRYYRFSEGLPSDAPMSVAEYLRVKLASRPLATIDTAFNGLFVQPFDTKWHGFEHWAPGMGAVLKWLALAGLMVTPFFAAGRLLLVILLASLVPYMFTWNVAGGGEWRFTMHAYPFYLVCAAFAVVGAGRLVAGLVQRTVQIRRAALARLAVRGTAVLALVAVGTAVYSDFRGWWCERGLQRGNPRAWKWGSVIACSLATDGPTRILTALPSAFRRASVPSFACRWQRGAATKSCSGWIRCFRRRKIVSPFCSTEFS